MRIGLGVAMTWEMFPDGQYASIFQTACITRCSEADKFGVIAERTCSNDGVLGIGVDVEYRGEVDLNAEFAALATHFETIHITKRVAHVFVDLAECAVAGVLDGIAQTHGQTPFSVDTDHHTGQTLFLCNLLEAVDEFGVGGHGAFAQ